MINKININDLKNFNKLGNIINPKFTKLFKLENLINSKYDYIYGYYINNKLIGFIHITKLYEVIDIINIVVDNKYQRQGIGTKLINYILNLFDDATTIMLEVNKNNQKAINLYLKNQFIIINEREKYYGNESALIMKREI